jgi:uncharacterized protein YhfF
LQPRRRRRKTMIDMKITSRRVVNNYEHKRCKIRTTKIKITMIKKVASSYNQKGGEGR